MGKFLGNFQLRVDLNHGWWVLGKFSCWDALGPVKSVNRLQTTSFV